MLNFNLEVKVKVGASFINEQNVGEIFRLWQRSMMVKWGTWKPERVYRASESIWENRWVVCEGPFERAGANFGSQRAMLADMVAQAAADERAAIAPLDLDLIQQELAHFTATR